MPAGIETYNDSGTVQLDTTYLGAVLVQTGTSQPAYSTGPAYSDANNWNSFIVRYTPYDFTKSSPIFAAVGAGGYAVTVIYTIRVSHYDAATSTTVADNAWDTYIISQAPAGTALDYYIFDKANPNVSDPGIDIFDSTGARIYNSSQYPMRVIDSFVGSYTSLLSTTKTYTSGRIYAVAQGVWAGKRQWLTPAKDPANNSINNSLYSIKENDLAYLGGSGQVTFSNYPYNGGMSGYGVPLSQTDPSQAYNYDSTGLMILDVTSYTSPPSGSAAATSAAGSSTTVPIIMSPSQSMTSAATSYSYTATVNVGPNSLSDAGFATNKWSFAPNTQRMTANGNNGFAQGADYTLDWPVPGSGTTSAETNNSLSYATISAGTYTITVFIQKNASVPTGTQLSFGVRWYDSNTSLVGGGSTYSLTSDNLTAGAPPQQFSLEEIAPTGATKGLLWLYVTPRSGNAGNIRFERPIIAAKSTTIVNPQWFAISPSGGGSWSITNGTSTSATFTVSNAPGNSAVSSVTAQCQFLNNNVSQSLGSTLSLTNSTAGPSVAMSPGNQSPTGTATSNTFGAETVTVTNGTASAYAWSIISSSGGTFSLANATTATCTPSVTGVTNTSTATATLQCVTTISGTNYTNTTSLSYQNTTSSGVTFSPIAGTYSQSDGGSSALQSFTITASASVTWTWTRSGTNGTSNVVSGNAATSITFSQGVGTADRSGTWTVTASGAGSGTWTITLSTTGTGTVCVVLDTYLPRYGQARWVRVGDYLDIAHPVTFAERRGLVSVADHTTGECVRITTRTGIELECTTTAPIAVKDGSMILAPELLGHTIPVKDNDIWGHDDVIAVEPIGVREIVHITCEDDVFLAGKHDGRYVLHHNIKAV